MIVTRSMGFFCETSDVVACPIASVVPTEGATSGPEGTMATTAANEPVELSEEEEAKMQEAAELLEEVRESTKETGGRLEDRHVIRFFRMKLLSMPCQNQGFILDGFPKTMEQAHELFKSIFHSNTFPTFPTSLTLLLFQEHDNSYAQLEF